MNITEQLYQIIIKYRLDRYYPGFQKNLQAENIIKDMALDTKADAEILLLGSRQMDIENAKRLIGKYRTVKGIVLDINQPENILEKLYCSDNIWLVSLYRSEKVIELLDQWAVKFKYIYDVFLCQGLICEGEYYHIWGEENYKKDYFEDIYFGKQGSKIQLEYFFVRKKYQETKNTILQNICLEKMLFLTLYMKNFKEAEQCVRELCNRECDLDIESAWAEIKYLLDSIKKELLKRKRQDIVWFWMDSISYDNAKGMDYLKKVKEKSISFLNAYTNGPFTNPTLKATFCGKRYVKDRSDTIYLNQDTSDLLTYLKGKDYQVKIISGYWNTDIITDSEVKYDSNFFDPSSMIFWNMLECLTSLKKSCFILAHALMETHLPCLSLKMQSLYDKKERYDYGKAELDEQMEYYSSFLDETVAQIFMSDHGQPEEDFEARVHIHLDIYHPRLQPKKVEEMFSILDFFALIKQLTEDKEIVIDKLIRHYVPIECMDLYNPKLLLEKRDKFRISLFGYMGALSKDEIYLRFSTGNEFLHNRKDRHWRPLLFVESEIEDSTNLEQLREAAGEYPLEILQEDKFRYSRGFHELYRIYREHSADLKKRLNEKLDKILQNYSNGSVAIRMGGLHSYYLCSILNENVQKKIGSFIDQNLHCICATHRKVITKEQLVEEKMEAVILSSFDYRRILREESVDYPKDVNVIDIYDVFEELGYSFTGNFFDTMGIGEDIINDTIQYML